MSGKSPQQLRRFACIIPHASRRCILMLSENGRWGLPTARVGGPGLRNPTPKLREVLTACGMADMQASLLRFARLSRELTVWQCQNDDPSWRPPAHGRWVDREQLNGLELADPSVQAELEEWFDEFDTPPAGRAPWECQGWWQGPMAWIRDQLRAEARPAVDRSEGGKVCSPWSYAVRIRTAEGSCFFKAVRSWNHDEPRLTQTLAGLFPDRAPEVIAVNEEQGWLLMKDFGRHLREVGEDVDVMRGAVRRFAELQIDSLQHLDAIADAGCPDLRADESAELDVLFGRIEETLAGSGERGHAAARRLLPRCLELARSVVSDIRSFRIPHALVHGDFTWINIARRPGAGEYVYFDWGGSCISHPFMCIAKFAGHCDQWRDVIDAYLAAWEAYGSPEELMAVFELSRHLDVIHTARRYVRHLRAVEKWLGRRVLDWIADLVGEIAGES